MPSYPARTATNSTPADLRITSVFRALLVTHMFHAPHLSPPWLLPCAVRADVIRQFHERGEDSMVEVLTELEADEFLRGQVVEALRRVK